MTNFRKPNEHKPRVAVHKFSSCDGCQLAFLNLGQPLLQLAQLVDIVHFAEAGPLDSDAKVDIAFVEGSISTPDEAQRIQRVRANSRYLISIGACATSGGLQALRNNADVDEWMAAIYPSPEFIETLATSTPVSEHVRVDLELWGCPINGHQVISTVRALLFGVTPPVCHDSVCMECKRSGNTCVLVTRSEPCMGPVTGTGCGALCPSVGRACYACYGPAENPNAASLARRFEGFGLLPEEVAHRFAYINNHAPAFAKAASQVSKESSDG